MTCNLAVTVRTLSHSRSTYNWASK